MPSHGCNGPPAQAFPWTKRPSRRRDARVTVEGFAKTIKMLNKKSLVASRYTRKAPPRCPGITSRTEELHDKNQARIRHQRPFAARLASESLAPTRSARAGTYAEVGPSPSGNIGLTANRQSKERPGAIASCSTHRKVVPGAVRPGRGRFITVEKDAA
jgi:hypothetical protein